MKKKFPKKTDPGPKTEATAKKHRFYHKEKSTKDGRLILRNLPFKCTENELKEHLSAFGDIVEVTFLKRDGKFTGCGFVQFTTKKSAVVALAKTSGKNFKGRPVIVDWAVPKNKYQASRGEDGVKEEIKEEEEEGEGDDASVKEESDNEIKGEPSSAGEDDDEESEEDDVKPNMNLRDSKPTRKRIIDDPDNKRTVFIRNIPFSATNEDLEKAAEELGQVSYALVCVDPLTEHSKGTGFVRFYDEQVAQDLINGVTTLNMTGSLPIPMSVKPKDQLDNDQSKKHPKDTRNLYLAKEGVIIAGSPAAEGVSESDMRKRLQLESWKTRVLKDLHMFVSPTRLVVHNVPPFYDNARLAKLFKEHAPKGAVLKEARIMKTVNDDILGKSKGYAFVSFNRHEDALAVLRKLNNNPDVFIDKKRPIISFSVENRRALNLKEKRQQNSALKLKQQKEEGKQKTSVDRMELDSESTSKPKFMGLPAKVGSQKLRRKHQLKEQVALHRKNLKKSKKTPKISRKQKRLKRQQHKM